MCTCDRRILLQRVLRSLQVMNLDGLDTDGLELIVVDNSPTGEARAICDSIAEHLPISLHFAEEPRRGISFARNKAVEVALSRGADFIAFMDDDDWPEPDWLVRLIETQRATEAQMVFGYWRVEMNGHVPSRAKATPLFQQPSFDSKTVFGLPRWASTCNVLVRRDVLEGTKANGSPFAAKFAHIGGEDKDFFIRAVKDGVSFACAGESIVHKYNEECRTTSRGLILRAFRVGCSTMNVVKEHGTASDVSDRRFKAIRKLARSTAVLPVAMFSERRRMKHLWRISRTLGVLYSDMGKNFRYY